MRYRPLGATDISVSLICLGTMTWGEQNSEAEAHRQLDYAVGQGVNFLDTAEMYAIPARAETFGRTEEIIGSWMRGRSDRDRLVIATKVSGPGDFVAHIRHGPRLTRDHIETALDGSLRRLGTDYVDLLQVHWPERSTNFFGRLGYSPEPDGDAVPIEETHAVLAELVASGKVRHIGISNETPWGLHRYLHGADTRSLPRVVSIQNPYSLLNRSFEVGLAEMSLRESVGLLPYSPLGFGVLTGKYLDDSPPSARLTLYPQYTRYSNRAGVEATRRYAELARRHGLAPATLALAYVNSRPFVTSTIIGATTMEQLEQNIASAHVDLSAEILGEIEAIHEQHPNPCP